MSNSPEVSGFAKASSSFACSLEWLAVRVARHQSLLGTVLLAVIALSALGHAAQRMFTYDEQITWRTARMSMHAIWEFYAQGLDTTGPVPSLLAQAGLWLPQSPEIALRVPFLLAFAAMCWGLWGFLRQRYAAGFALAALVLPLELMKLVYFRTDARAYALMLCAAGVGMRLWQLASEGKARPWSVLGLWLVLAVGMSAHFFTVFLFLPFAVAQWVLDRGRKKLDWPVWTALLLFPLGWLPLAPGEFRAHRLYAGNFWSKPTLENLGDAYEQMIESSWPVLFVLGIFLIGLALWRWHAARSAERPAQTAPVESQPHTGLRRAEWVLVITLLLLPLVAWCAAQALGAFQHIYVISYAAGLTVVIAAGVAELAGRNARVGVLFFLLLTVLALADSNGAEAVDGVLALADRGEAHAELARRFQSTDWVRWLDHSSLPVAADNETYVKLALYGSPALAARSYALTNFAEATKYPRAMTDQNNMRYFGRQIGFQHMEISDFQRQNPHFLLLQQRSQRFFEWMTSCLLEQRKQNGSPKLEVRFMDAGGRLFVYEASTAE